MTTPDGCERCREGVALNYREGMTDADISAYLSNLCGNCLRTVAAYHGRDAATLESMSGPFARSVSTALGRLATEAISGTAYGARAAYEHDYRAILAATGVRLRETIASISEPHRRIAELAGEELRRREAGG